jgi:hypothetical protein
VRDEDDGDDTFDWSEVTADALDPASATAELVRYARHLLGSGVGEGVVRDGLAASGVRPEDADVLLLAARRPLPEVAAPAPMLLPSGRYDFGGVLDHLHRQEAERQDRRRGRRERREKSARLAAAGRPDPAFELPETYAQAVAREAARRERRWVPILVGILVFLPLLAFVGVPFIRWVLAGFK